MPMLRLSAAFFLLFAGVLPFAGAARAQGTDLNQDLGAVIALQGQPCGRVTEAQRQGDNDFLVRCSDGSRYRVFVDAQRRTRVEKR
jgi:hypothetical protein